MRTRSQAAALANKARTRLTTIGTQTDWKPSEQTKDDCLTVTVRLSTGVELCFKVKETTPLNKICLALESRHARPENSYKLSYLGVTLLNHLCCRDYAIKDGAELCLEDGKVRAKNCKTAPL